MTGGKWIKSALGGAPNESWTRGGIIIIIMACAASLGLSYGDAKFNPTSQTAILLVFGIGLFMAGIGYMMRRNLNIAQHNNAMELQQQEHDNTMERQHNERDTQTDS